MRLPTLFKQPKNKSYNYTPRYYDERKERIANLIKQKEAKTNEEYFNGYRKKSYRDDWKSVIIILLFMFTVVALKYINLDKFF